MERIIGKVEEFFGVLTYKSGIWAIFLVILFKLALFLCVVKGTIYALWNGNPIMASLISSIGILYIPCVAYAAFLLWICFWSPLFRNVSHIIVMPFLIAFVLFSVLPKAGFVPAKSFASMSPSQQTSQVLERAIRGYESARNGDQSEKILVDAWEKWNKPRKYTDYIQELREKIEVEKEQERRKWADASKLEKLLYWFGDQF